MSAANACSAEASVWLVAAEALPQRQPRTKRRRHAKVTNTKSCVLAESDVKSSDAEPSEAVVPDTNSVPLPLQEYRASAVAGYNFEWWSLVTADLDHTADVQLHAWGADLTQAFQNVGLAMFNYMTPLKGIAVEEGSCRTYEAEAHDLQSLLFQFLDELLFTFSTEFFVCKELRIKEFDRGAWRIVAEGRGERFDRSRHVSGTEVKAITYSAMQINEKEGDAEVFVIVDI